MKLAIATLLLHCFAAYSALADEPARGVRWGLMPIGNITSDRGINVGLTTRRFDFGQEGRTPFESVLTLQASYATLGPKDALVAYEKVFSGDLPFRLFSEARFSQNDYQPFYGLGDQSVRDRSNSAANFYRHAQNDASFEGSVRKKTAFHGIDAQLGFLAAQSETAPVAVNSQYATEIGSLPSMARYAKLYARFILENRDSEFIPSQGHYASAGIGVAPDFLSSTGTWTRTDLDYRRYDLILENRRLWLASQFRSTHSSDQAPLIEKARLGSITTMRGLPLNRYLSNHSLSLRTELRSIWFRSELFDLPLKAGTGLFADTGKSADTFSRLGSNPLQTAWGMSFFWSYFTDEFLNTADLAFSREGFLFYFKLGHSF